MFSTLVNGHTTLFMLAFIVICFGYHETKLKKQKTGNKVFRVLAVIWTIIAGCYCLLKITMIFLEMLVSPNNMYMIVLPCFLAMVYSIREYINNEKQEKIKQREYEDKHRYS